MLFVSIVSFGTSLKSFYFPPSPPILVMGKAFCGGFMGNGSVGICCVGCLVDGFDVV